MLYERWCKDLEETSNFFDLLVDAIGKETASSGLGHGRNVVFTPPCPTSTMVAVESILVTLFTEVDNLG